MESYRKPFFTKKEKLRLKAQWVVKTHAKRLEAFNSLPKQLQEFCLKPARKYSRAVLKKIRRFG